MPRRSLVIAGRTSAYGTQRAIAWRFMRTIEGRLSVHDDAGAAAAGRLIALLEEPSASWSL
jgi:hypothetical protein